MSAITPVRVQLGPYAALAYRFEISVDDPLLAGHVEEMLTGLRDEEMLTGLRDESPARVSSYRIVGAGGHYGLSQGQHVLVRSGSAARTLATLMWHVNQQAVASAAADHVVVHAAAAVRDHESLLLPAPMESGKTTLVAGLVARGWGYLTDEAAAIALDSGLVRCYGKPLSLDPGTHSLFPALCPAASPASLRTGQWQVPASAIRPDAVAEPAPVGAVIFPRYVPAARTELRPVSRGEALARLADCAFTWSPPYAPRWRRLADSLRASRCAELTVGDLGTACAAIDAFWERP